MENQNLSPNWLNGKYKINGFDVVIDYNLSFACFEKNEEECYTFQGDEANKVIEEIAVIYNTDKNAPTQKEAIKKWINTYL